MKYSDGKIYKIVFDDGHFYFGSTTQTLEYRLRGHIYTIKREPERLLYTLDWTNARIELVQEYPCENKLQLTTKETEFIYPNLNDPLCVNRRVALLTDQIKQEVYQKNRENRLNQVRMWREANMERHTQNVKNYYETHKKETAEYQKKYQELNKERIREQQRLAHIRRKEEKNR